MGRWRRCSACLLVLLAVLAAPAACQVVSITLNATRISGRGGWLSIQVTNSGPSALDYLAVFAPADANVSATAPIRVIDIVRWPNSSAYATDGRAEVPLRLSALPGGYRVSLLRSGASSGGSGGVGAQIPAWNRWLSSGAKTELSWATVGMEAPAAPSLVRVMPAEAYGTLRIGWTSLAAQAQPTLQWSLIPPDAPPASSLGVGGGWPVGAPVTSVPATSVSRINHSALCPDFPPSLRSLARAEGWIDTGLQYSAVLAMPPTVYSALPHFSRLYYRVGDAAAAAADVSINNVSLWSSIASVVAPPPLRLLSSSNASTVGSSSGAGAASGAHGFLLLADTGVGPVAGDLSMAFRRRGEATAAGLRFMSARAQLGGWRMPLLGMAIVGDLNYGDGLLGTTIDAISLMEPLTASLPFMWGVGNHEGAYSGRGGDFWTSTASSGGECNVPNSIIYPQPRGATALRPWFWLAAGAAAFVHLSTEHNFTTGSEQHSWVQGVLRGLNRSITPVLVVIIHRPMLIFSGQDAGREDGHQAVASLLRQHVLPLLVSARATLLLTGHHHSYQRHCPVLPAAADGGGFSFNASVPDCAVRGASESVTLLSSEPQTPPGVSATAAVYRSLPAPLSINIGNGGSALDVEPASSPGSATLETLVMAHGYGLLGVSGDGRLLDFEMRAYADDAVLDRVRIEVDVPGVAAAQAAAWSLEDMLVGSVGAVGAVASPSAAAATPPSASPLSATVGASIAGAVIGVGIVGAASFAAWRRSTRRRWLHRRRGDPSPSGAGGRRGNTVTASGSGVGVIVVEQNVLLPRR